MFKFCSAAVLGLVASLALASPSQLTKAQMAKMKKLGRVVVPTYIPAGFKLKKVTFDPGEYDLEYTGPRGADLLVQMASDGIGDISLGNNADPKTLKETTRKVTNPVLGTQEMQVDIAKDDREFAVNWIDLGDKAKPRFLSIIGSSMNADLGAKVWKGLRFLK
ncbi:MAG TPA: hypothetical protein VGL56_14735 [Fimbriimonadaceae bacterium]|jgi:hypothetical protein